jgi:ribonuclease D
MAAPWLMPFPVVGSSSLSITRQPVIWVNQQAHLDELCQQWLRCPLLAVDTEFMRTNTFYPQPALLQVNDGQANYLIDPLDVNDFASLAAVMTSPTVQKVLHSCSEDLDVFYRLFRCLPANLLDTQVAAAFCGHGFSLGYSNLVSAMLAVDLPKGETRSNWLQRPLTDAQKVYAALDVEYLFELAVMLNQQLAERERHPWVAEECRLLVDHYLEGHSPEHAVTRFKAAWRLDNRQLALLDRLAQWRDGEAQARDIPRSYVLKDTSLFAIAETMPNHLNQLRKVPEMVEKSLRRYGEHVLAMVAVVAELPEIHLPERMPRPPSSKQQLVIKNIREALMGVAEQHQIAVEYLARKRDFEHIMRAHGEGKSGEDLFPVSLQSWRAPLVKSEILKHL